MTSKYSTGQTSELCNSLVKTLVSFHTWPREMFDALWSLSTSTTTVAYKASIGTQTLNVEVLYAAFKKESVASEQLGTSDPPCKTCVTDNKVVNQEEPELYSNSEHFYQNPGV